MCIRDRVKGAPIPIYRNGVQLGYRKDKDGNTIITKLNEDMLSELAVAGGGEFFRANNGHIGLKAILDEINTLESTEMETKMFSDYEDRFQYFLIDLKTFQQNIYSLQDRNI